MRNRHFAVSVTYDHGAINAIDIEEAIEEHLKDRTVVNVTVVCVGERLHELLLERRIDD